MRSEDRSFSHNRFTLGESSLWNSVFPLKTLGEAEMWTGWSAQEPGIRSPATPVQILATQPCITTRLCEFPPL